MYFEFAANAQRSLSFFRMASINLRDYEDEDEDGYDDEDAGGDDGYGRGDGYGDGYGDEGSDEDGGGGGGGEGVSGMASMPNELKALRACMVCSLVKTFNQFIDEGCDNCESFLGMRDRQDSVSELTSHTFEG